MEVARKCYDSPVGRIELCAKDGQLASVRWGGDGDDRDDILEDAISQLGEYFSGQLRQFDLPVSLDVTPGQKRLLDALGEISFGDTRTYGDLAKELGLSAQAVGQMCGANPIPIIIPCHRVLGANSLGGFSAPGGIETKVKLLRHEGAAGLLI